MPERMARRKRRQQDDTCACGGDGTVEHVSRKCTFYSQLFSDLEKKGTLFGKTIFSGAATKKRRKKDATEQLSL